MSDDSPSGIAGFDELSLDGLPAGGTTVVEGGPGADGVELPGLSPAAPTRPVSHERVSTGVEGLDRMLSGGVYRATPVLVSGAPGTAKTTLVEAGEECRRILRERRESPSGVE